MNIVILGAGAIGSLFGAMLSNKNNVTLVGRKTHVEAIKEKGLTIKGMTNLKIKIPAVSKIENISTTPDLLILTVKSYDTLSAVIEAKKIIDEKNTNVLSLQNGLNNIEEISKHVKKEKIFAGVTTQAAMFKKPGVVEHTGTGETLIGGLTNKRDIPGQIAKKFNESGIKTKVSKDIKREIWVKVIINSSINPLTAFFQCKNGYLLENPFLEKITEKICAESTNIARNIGIKIKTSETIKKTKEVIKKTKENYSSMAQSIKQGKKTEIDSINGKLYEIGKKQKLDVTMNEMLTKMIKSLSQKK